MKRQTDIIIVGTGTAALAAAGEVKKYTDRFLIFSNGVYGTTCVRAGCMPSKAFIRGSQLYHLQKSMARWGIGQGVTLSLDIPALLAQVRSLRDYFLSYTLQTTEQYRPHIIEGDVRFISPTQLRVSGELYEGRSVILATGSSPIIPPECAASASHILTTETLFEQENLPHALGVSGLSVLGAEMAQAFARLDIRVVAEHENALIGGLTDPQVSAYAVQCLGSEMDIRLHQADCLRADTLFVARSRAANLADMGLEECGIIKPGAPVFDFDPETMQVGDLPLYVAGDVKSGRSILNEAVHEGKIAGYNAAHAQIRRFKRRMPLQIVHTDPVIAVAGRSWEELKSQDVLSGKCDYENQGSATILGKPAGLVHIYADRQSRQLLGAELFAPAGEHLAHQLAWLIDRQVNVEEALELPFYHPSLEEGLRTALESIPS